jgi:hypothetical protein
MSHVRNLSNLPNSELQRLRSELASQHKRSSTFTKAFTGMYADNSLEKKTKITNLKNTKTLINSICYRTLLLSREVDTIKENETKTTAENFPSPSNTLPSLDPQLLQTPKRSFIPEAQTTSKKRIKAPKNWTQIKTKAQRWAKQNQRYNLHESGHTGTNKNQKTVPFSFSEKKAKNKDLSLSLGRKHNTTKPPPLKYLSPHGSPQTTPKTSHPTRNRIHHFNHQSNNQSKTNHSFAFPRLVNSKQSCPKRLVHHRNLNSLDSNMHSQFNQNKLFQEDLRILNQMNRSLVLENTNLDQERLQSMNCSLGRIHAAKHVNLLEYGNQSSFQKRINRLKRNISLIKKEDQLGKRKREAKQAHVPLQNKLIIPFYSANKSLESLLKSSDSQDLVNLKFALDNLSLFTDPNDKIYIAVTRIQKQARIYLEQKSKKHAINKVNVFICFFLFTKGSRFRF